MISTNSHSRFALISQPGSGLAEMNTSGSIQGSMDKEAHFRLEQPTGMKQLVTQIEKPHPPSREWLDWEVFCDLLSGASWSEVYAQWFPKRLNKLEPEYLDRLLRRFTDRRQFQFSDSHGAIAPLESLWLKWRLIATVSDWVLRIHTQTHQPLLNLHPSKFRIFFPENSDPLLP
ncbi:MAG: hypothetical protein ACPGYT_15280, partial [Nitrospirales bacterium]